ncbi:MAG: glycosyl hydrolase family 5 [Isosphaerales bacterium]
MRFELAIVLSLVSSAAISAGCGIGRARSEAGETQKRSAAERYDEPDTRSWYRDALDWDAAPVDLRFLNRDERPAGRRGFIQAVGDRLVFEDGTPARLWGSNLAANALFSTPRGNVARQAKRMAQLGYNLMRIHHHDSEGWVRPNIFGNRSKNSRRLDPKSLDALDWWIKCLKDEGIYVWLDMRVGRVLNPADGVKLGPAEIMKKNGLFAGFDYYNPELQDLMKEFQKSYLGHFNRYTSLAYKDDPAVIGVLITNEDDLTEHYGNMMLPDYHLTEHNALWTRGYKAFAKEHGLPADRVYQTWLPGPSKIYLSDVEHRFNEIMIGELKALGVKVPIATTNYWGNCALYSLPALADGDVIDAHSYGKSEALETNVRSEANYIAWIGAGHVHGKPLTISEWNVEYPATDRFTAPLYVAGIAALQGWDAPMLYDYSQNTLIRPTGVDKWSTYFDPALTGVMPAAALAYRQGHISPARQSYCLMPGPALLSRRLDPKTSATIRTLMEQSKLTIGLPAVKELPWLKASRPKGETVITDPDRDFIPQGQSFVRSDTGEMTRDWELGIQTIDAPRTQAVSGWIGGKTLKTRDATFQFRTKKAVVALTSIDNQPLSGSGFILITAMARAVASPGSRTPMLSEPVVGTISLRASTQGLELLALGGDGRVIRRSSPARLEGALTISIPSGGGTHWFVLKVDNAAKESPKAGSRDPG